MPPATMLHGLPNQSLGQWRDTLARAVELAPEHLSLYSLTVEPGNAALRAMAEAAAALRAAGRPTVPTTMAEELAANPFLRAPDVDTLAEIRAAKDKFR